jgi:thiamine-phosphate pyrophosphorylase
MIRLPPPLVALTPGDLSAETARTVLQPIGAAVRAGLSGILLREPSLPDRVFLELAREIRALLGRERWLAIHDRVHLAAASGADGAHVGFRSLAPAEARAVVGESIAVGFSAHARDDPARWTGADYLFFGPVKDTPSKRGLEDATGFDGLAAAVRRSAQPVWAIGGLAPEDAAGCVAAGAAGIAVLSGILPSRDPGAAAAAYLARLVILPA